MWWRKERESWESQQIESLKIFKAIGEEFEYLGVRLKVVGHYYKIPPVPGGGDYRIPALITNYVDGHGVIKEKIFELSEIPALKHNYHEASV